MNAAEPSKPFVFFVSDQVSYDDNLFRLPDDRQGTDLALGQDSEDYVNRLTAGLRAQMHKGRQDLLLSARINDVRFQNNDHLDYTGGAANLVFDWELGSRWSGRATADYLRTLASYTNYRFLERDVLDAVGGELEASFRLGPHFALMAGGRAAQTDHSDQTRQADNFESSSGRAGLEYSRTPRDRFILEYRYLEGKFPDRLGLEPQDIRRRDYEEDLINLRMEYELTSKLRFRGNLGQIERDYPFDLDNPGFSGEIWRGTFEWQPRRKLGFELSAWHELKAYIDSESNYFVAEGASFGPTWKPVEKIELALSYVYEQQDYIGTPTASELGQSAGAPLLTSDAAREDEIQVARMTASYAPREFIELKLLCAYEDRSSNRSLRAHDAQVVGMEVRVIF